MDLRDLFPLPLPWPRDHRPRDPVWRDPRTGEPVDVPGIIEDILNPPAPPPPPPVDAQPAPEPAAPPPAPTVSPEPFPLEQLPRPEHFGPTLPFPIPTRSRSGRYEDPRPRRTAEQYEREARRYAREGYDLEEFCADYDIDIDECYPAFLEIFRYEEAGVVEPGVKILPRAPDVFVPNVPPPNFMESPRAQSGPVLRGIGELLKRIAPKIVPRVPRRRPRRTPKTPAPVRRRPGTQPERPVIRPLPRPIPGPIGPPDWTSPFPRIPRTKPQRLPSPRIEPRPRPLEVPRPVPEFPIPPPRAPELPRLPSPFPPPEAPPQRTQPQRTQPQPSRQPRPSRAPQPARTPRVQPRTWPFTWPFSSPNVGRPAPWQWPGLESVPRIEPQPLPFAPGEAISPQPLPMPQPFSPPLTALNPNTLRCPPCPTRKRKQRRKCRASAPVRWAGGPRKGELAGNRCYSFVGE